MIDRATLEAIRAEVRKEVRREAGEFDARLHVAMAPMEERVDRLVRRIMDLDGRLDEAEEGIKRSEALSLKAKRYADARASESIPPQADGPREPMPSGQFTIATELDMQAARMSEQLEHERVQKEKLLGEILKTKDLLETAQARNLELESDRLKNRHALTLKVAGGIFAVLTLLVSAYVASSHATGGVPPPREQGQLP